MFILAYFGSAQGIIARRKEGDHSHIKIGVTRIEFWVKGHDEVRRVKEIGKPHCEFSMNEIEDLLEELDALKRLHGVDS